MRSLLLLVLLAGCPPPPPVPIHPKVGPDGCIDILADAAVRVNQTMQVRARTDQMKVLPDTPDFNFDGRPDIVVRFDDDRDHPMWWWHVLYVRTQTCPSPIAVIQAAQVGCMDTQSNGMCDLDLVLQTGALHQHMYFDGRRYHR